MLKTNYINRKSIGNIPNFVAQKSILLINLLLFPLANCYNHVRFFLANSMWPLSLIQLQSLWSEWENFIGKGDQKWDFYIYCVPWIQCNTLKHKPLYNFQVGWKQCKLAPQKIKTLIFTELEWINIMSEEKKIPCIDIFGQHFLSACSQGLYTTISIHVLLSFYMPLIGQ